jgi:hypothetical protein
MRTARITAGAGMDPARLAALALGGFTSVCGIATHAVGQFAPTSRSGSFGLRVDDMGATGYDDGRSYTLADGNVSVTDSYSLPAQDCFPPCSASVAMNSTIAPDGILLTGSGQGFAGGESPTTGCNNVGEGQAGDDIFFTVATTTQVSLRWTLHVASSRSGGAWVSAHLWNADNINTILTSDGSAAGVGDGGGNGPFDSSRSQCLTLLPGHYELTASGDATTSQNEGGWTCSFSYSLELAAVATSPPVLTTTFDCHATSGTITASNGPGTQTYDWQWLPPGSATWTDVVEGSNAGEFAAAGSQTATLALTDLSVSGAQFRCTVSNACASATSDPLTTGGCYANCDCSATAPVLNVGDFTCFLQKYAAQDPYANCDGSTAAPVLNVADFTCFLQKFAAGCP